VGWPTSLIEVTWGVHFVSAYREPGQWSPLKWRERVTSRFHAYFTTYLHLLKVKLAIYTLVFHIISWWDSARIFCEDPEDTSCISSPLLAEWSTPLSMEMHPGTQHLRVISTNLPNKTFSVVTLRSAWKRVNNRLSKNHVPVIAPHSQSSSSKSLWTHAKWTKEGESSCRTGQPS